MSGSPRGRIAIPDALRAPEALVALLALMAGIAVLRPVEDAIAAADARARGATARAEAEEATLAERPRIEAAAARIRTDLRGIALRTDPSAEALGLLLDVQRSARRNGVRILSLQPESAPEPGPLPARPRGLPAEESGRFELRLSGSFANTVATIADLSNLPTPLRVLDLRLERHESAEGHASGVDATIHLGTIRLRAGLPPLP